MPGTLYIVSTPIGNLEDITFRAVETLKNADLIAAEDTRHTKILLDRYGIKTPTTSYFEYNRVRKTDYLLKLIGEGKSVALVTDAGTPGISDPGYTIIRACVEKNIPVVPVPGPSALLAALSASGKPADTFTFVGFLSNKSARRRNELKRLHGEGRTVVLYESPHRIIKFLEDLLEVYSDTDIVLAREVTKKFEELRREKPSELIEHFKKTPPRGEFTIIV
jgi:16S rRNA (cytidine1402-2'-O)-methyltransferase